MTCSLHADVEVIPERLSKTRLHSIDDASESTFVSVQPASEGKATLLYVSQCNASAADQAS